MNKIVLAVALCAVASSGCATHAGGVAPVAVASTDSAGLNCERARKPLVQRRVDVDALTRRQNAAAAAHRAGDASTIPLWQIRVAPCPRSSGN